MAKKTERVKVTSISPDFPQQKTVLLNKKGRVIQKHNFKGKEQWLIYFGQRGQWWFEVKYLQKL